jgi:hypothetical protein
MNNSSITPSKVRRWSLLILLCTEVLLFTEWHMKIAQRNARMDMLKQSARDYGRGLHGHFDTIPAAVPQENEYDYANKIRNLFLFEKFSELDNIARTNREEPGFVTGGGWKNFDFYSAIDHPVSFHQLTDADYQNRIEKVTRWKASFPESAAARISLASLYLEYGWFARGTGYDNTVSAHNRKLFKERTAIAEQILIDAAQLKERDPYWYFAMLCIAQNQGWSKTDTRELFERAVAFEPGYYHFYTAYTSYLLPQWYGEVGDIQALAQEAAAKYPEPRGSVLYFQTMSTLGCHCRTIEEQLTKADWSKLKRGYTNLTRIYGTSNYNANRLAAMATVFCDKETAHAAFKAVSYRDTYVWTDELSFTGSRDWANSPGGQ